MTDEATQTQHAAECRERAARYEALAAEARERGHMQVSIEFSGRAAQELIEASRIEEGIRKLS